MNAIKDGMINDTNVNFMQYSSSLYKGGVSPIHSTATTVTTVSQRLKLLKRVQSMVKAYSEAHTSLRNGKSGWGYTRSNAEIQGRQHLNR